MPAPYSYALRTKAVNAVKEGARKTAVCRMFKISRNTLDLWLKREQETGDFRAITNYQPGKPLKIQDLEAFRQLVLQHKRKTQQQLAELWGDNLTQQNVSDALKKLGITRKSGCDPAVVARRLERAPSQNLWVSREG